MSTHTEGNNAENFYLVIIMKQDMARGRTSGLEHSAIAASDTSVAAVASSEQSHSPVSSSKQQKPKSKAFEKLWSLDYQSGGGSRERRDGSR